MRLRPKLPARTASRKCVSSLSPPNVRTPHECYVAVATDGTLDSRRFARQGIYGGYVKPKNNFFFFFFCGGRAGGARQKKKKKKKIFDNRKMTQNARNTSHL